MTDGLVNIIYFLTKQNVQKDMQKEIMKYYQSKKKYRLLILQYDDNKPRYESEDFLYLERIEYGPIDQIDFSNLFKFLHDENKKTSYDYYCKVIQCSKNGIEYACRDSIGPGVYNLLREDLIFTLKTYGVYRGNCWRNILKASYGHNITLFLKTIEL